MKITTVFIALSALIPVGPLLAADSVKRDSRVYVTFVAPEKFTDVKDDWSSSEGYRDGVLAELKRLIETTAPAFVAEGQRLEIMVTDVDLAGEFEPAQGPDFNHIRILREIYPPRMKVEFRLLGTDGQVVSEGKRHLRQLGYLMTLAQPTYDPLRYDKDLIRTWLRQEFKRSP